MQRRVSSLTGASLRLLGCLVSIVVPACIPRYEPPTPSQPHAIAKVRRTYETTGGTSLREVVTINGYGVVQETVPSAIDSARTDGTLVHPGTAEWNVRSTFFHKTRQMVRQSYTEQEPYSAHESYNCGTYSAPRTCYRTRTQYRSVTKYKNVWQDVEVVDGSCEASLTHQAVEGEVYLLQFTYQDTSACSFACYVQGDDANQHCARPPSSD